MTFFRSILNTILIMGFLSSLFGCSTSKQGSTKGLALTKDFNRKSHYSIRLPDQWKVDEDPESALISGPDSYGTLQIWAYQNPNPPLPDDDLLAFAADVVDMGFTSTKSSCGSFTGFRFDYPKGETFFRRWCLQSGNGIIVASHFCPIAHKGKDDTVIDAIMGTLTKP